LPERNRFLLAKTDRELVNYCCACLINLGTLKKRQLQAHHVADSHRASKKGVERHFLIKFFQSKSLYHLIQNSYNTSAFVSLHRYFSVFVKDNMIEEF